MKTIYTESIDYEVYVPHKASIDPILFLKAMKDKYNIKSDDPEHERFMESINYALEFLVNRAIDW